MQKSQPKKNILFRKFRHKYRFVVQNESTYEERFSFRMSRMNVFIFLVGMSIILIASTTYIIAFTPLREYIPGYTDVTLAKKLYDLQLRADSLNNEFRQKDLFIKNIKNIIAGNAIYEEEDPDQIPENDYSDITITRSVEDSVLRQEFESRDKYNLYPFSGNVASSDVPSLSVYSFFPPLKGIITNHFDQASQHFGIDIVAHRNDAVKCLLDGTVIFSNWTLATGWVIGVQHKSNLISVYKHNAALLKKTGDYVKAGEPISIVGNSGELTTGPHLHFELWHNGRPLNPENYISF